MNVRTGVRIDEQAGERGVEIGPRLRVGVARERRHRERDEQVAARPGARARVLPQPREQPDQDAQGGAPGRVVRDQGLDAGERIEDDPPGRRVAVVEESRQRGRAGLIASGR